jgi:hydrogenase/urease accessory protein HupE
MFAATLAGFTAGLIHVLSGPDHLAAVAPLADDRGRAWRAGFLWGLGHSGGVFGVAVLALALRGALPIEAVSSWSERLVGVALIGIGLWGFTRVLRGPIHSHVHVRAAAAVGVLHGVAGSSHFLGVLPALALPSAAASFGYLAGFALGTVAGMTGFAGALGLFSGAENAPRQRQWLLSASSAAAIVVGLVWMRG